MRFLFVVAVISISTTVSAQRKSKDKYQMLMDGYKAKTLSPVKQKRIPTTAYSIITPLPKEPAYSQTLPSGAKVYILPVDNMPCVVPEVVAVMPVLSGSDIKPGEQGAIPNPGYSPLVIKPITEPKTPVLIQK